MSRLGLRSRALQVDKDLVRVRLGREERAGAPISDPKVLSDWATGIEVADMTRMCAAC